MRIWAIGDLHLSFGVANKSMVVFRLATRSVSHFFNHSFPRQANDPCFARRCHSSSKFPNRERFTTQKAGGKGAFLLVGCIALTSFGLFASDKSEKDTFSKQYQKVGMDMSQVFPISVRDIPSYLPRLIELRAVTYRAYPYLYEQNLADEEEYVTQYAKSHNTVLVLARNGADVSGMAIGLPLSAAQDWIKEAFAKYSGKIDDVFYVGDIVTSHDDSRLKDLLFNDLESVLKTQKKFSTIAVCEVYRDECPRENAQIDQYWTANGYQKREDLKSVFWWKDHDKSQKTPKTLIYWIKKI